MRRRPRAALSALYVLACCALLVAVPAAGASAHNRLRSTDPADGAVVASAPAQVVLTFDQPGIALGSEVVVLGPDGTTVSAGDPRLVDDDVTQDLAGDLPAGQYRVEWRVTSADGHPVEGDYSFTASGPGTGAGAPPPASAAASAAAADGARDVAAPAPRSSGFLAVAGAVSAAAVLGAALAVVVVLRRRRSG